MELFAMVEMALAGAQGALARRESRGAHSRTDYAQRDDEHWLKHTLAHYTPDGPRLTYRAVTMGRFAPQQRTY